SSRLALVPARRAKGQSDRLTLRLGGGPVGDHLQGGPTISRVPSHRTPVVSSHCRVSSTLATRRPVSTVVPTGRNRGHIGRENPAGAGSPQSAVAGDGSTGRTDRCSGSITSVARRIARRMTFRSSRTFPGQW